MKRKKILMNKEIDNFVDEFISSLQNSKKEREEKIKNFVEVFNKKVPQNYKFELTAFNNYFWDSKLQNNTLSVGIDSIEETYMEVCISKNYTYISYFKFEKFPNEDMLQTLLKVLFDLEDKDPKELDYLIEVDLGELDEELDEMFANLK